MDTAPRHGCPHYASHAHAHSLARPCAHDMCACACETPSELSNIEGQHTASCALPRLSIPADRKSSRRKSWREKSAPAPQARAFSSGSPPCPARERAMRLRRARRKRLRTPDERLSLVSSRRTCRARSEESWRCVYRSRAGGAPLFQCHHPARRMYAPASKRLLPPGLETIPEAQQVLTNCVVRGPGP
jgi:hypothetical protein